MTTYNKNCMKLPILMNTINNYIGSKEVQ